ncbi:MAG: hypothetical protein K0B02_05130 [DPANN group archaeon]|nr:hypothetical protein [DPANN group archaeon]
MLNIFNNKGIKKAQSATEYLMTYGWALLAIVVVAGVLFQMGLFGGSCTDTTNFKSPNMLVEGFAVDTDGEVMIKITNAMGNDITLTQIGSATTNITTSVGVGCTGTTIPKGTACTVTVLAAAINTPGAAGACYDGSLTIKYTSDGIPHPIAGSVAATISDSADIS